MANTLKALYRGAASTSNTTIYTVPASTTTLISKIVVTNTASTDATYDMSLNDVVIANDVSVPANDSVILDIGQVIGAAQTIKALASASTVNFHISGMEVS